MAFLIKAGVLGANAFAVLHPDRFLNHYVDPASKYFTIRQIATFFASARLLRLPLCAGNVFVVFLDIMQIWGFEMWIVRITLAICTCAYLHAWVGPFKYGDPTIFISEDHRAPRIRGWRGVAWRAARVGERLSPYVSATCMMLALKTFLV